VPQVTAGGVTGVPAITEVVVRAAQFNLGLTFMVPQSAASLHSPVGLAFTV